MPDRKSRNWSEQRNLCGSHLKRLRMSRNLTLTNLQEILKDHGMSIDRTNLGRIERGAREVSDIELVLFSSILGVSLEDLLWGGISPDMSRIGEALRNAEHRSIRQHPNNGKGT